MIAGYRRSALVVGALSLAAAACNPDVTSPTRISPSLSRRASVGADHKSPFHRNTEKYSDQASHPATGRSGSASIVARALLAKNGTTLIEATTGAALDAATTPPGNITKVQLKSINANGDAIRTVNFNGLSGGGYWSTSTDQLGRNAPIQIQTNVGGIDGKRNDVVTVKATVKKRPDLAVSAVSNPATAKPNAAVTITALVSEVNGDVGATSNCILLVDGTQVDQVNGMWVDGGTAVTCQFTHAFATAATYALEVRATNVVPADWDAANNSATGSIKIEDPIVKMSWNGYAEDYRYGNSFNGHESYNDCYYYYYSYCSGYENDVTYDNSYSNSNLYFSTSTGEAGASFPIDVAFTATSDGNTVAQMHGTVGDAGAQGCYGMYDEATGTQGQVCAYNNGYQGTQTTAFFQRNGGVSTYYSAGTGYNWNQQPTYCYYYDDWYGYWYSYQCGWYTYQYPNSWSYNNSGSSGSPFTLGSQATMGSTLTDANGKKFIAGGSFAISTDPNYTYSSSYYDCYNYGYYYGYNRCGTEQDWSNRRVGNGFGYGTAE